MSLSAPSFSDKTNPQLDTNPRFYIFILSLFISASTWASSSNTLCKDLNFKIPLSLTENEQIQRSTVLDHPEVVLNIIDFRKHPYPNQEVSIEHKFVKSSIQRLYHARQMLTSKVLDSFEKGHDGKSQAPISYFYLTQPSKSNLVGKEILGTIKLIKFEKSDPLTEWIANSSKEDLYLRNWPLLEVERKSKNLVLEHQNEQFINFRNFLMSSFDEFHSTDSQARKNSILNKIDQEKSLLHDSFFEVAELSGVSSIGRENAGFDVYTSLERAVLSKLRSNGAQNLYLLTANPELVNYYTKKGFQRGASHTDPESGILKTEMNKFIF